MINLLDDTTNQSPKFRTRNWVEINDESRGTYDYNSDMKFKNLMLSSILCGYNDVHIRVKASITVPNTADQGAALNNTNKKVLFKNCPPFTSFISKINNTQVYGNTIEMNQLYTIIIIIIFLQIKKILFHSNFNSK